MPCPTEHTRRCVRFLGVSILAMLALNPAVRANEVFTPTDDAYVRAQFPDSNYGSSAELQMRGLVAVRESYLKFDLSAFGGSATNATLRIYANTSSNPQTTAAHPVTDTSWSESTITWNNKPDYGSPLDSVSIGTTSYAWYEFDVTQYVQDQLAASQTLVSFALANLDDDGSVNKARSKEYSNSSQWPQLVITAGAGEPPAITAHPQSQTVEYGDPAQFTVSATGDPEPSYQWRKDGAELSGEVSDTLAIASAEFADEGTYDVVVSNSEGSVTSDPATLTVQDTTPPSVPQNLAASNITDTTVALSWEASTDNVAVDGYKVYTNGADPITVSATSTTMTGLAPGTQYTFTVSAFDAAGNESAQSEPVQVTTATEAPQPITVVAVDSSGDDGNVIENTIDGDPTTRWSVEGKANGGTSPWGEWTLDGDYVIDEVSIHQAFGDNGNPATFHIDLSLDGQNWTRVGTFTSSGQLDDFETYTFDAAETRYIRYIGEGRETSDWNSIARVAFVGVPAEPGPGPTPPSITEHPQSQTVEYGDPAQFTVSATGDPEPSYQWRKDGAELSGETSDTLAIASAEFVDEGTYDVVVSNSEGSVTSDPATLAVQDTTPPTAPGNLIATAISATRIDLEWEASTDNVGVAAYEIHRDGNLLDTTSNTAYSDTGLQPETTYSYQVFAFDDAENLSDPSNTAQATTHEESDVAASWQEAWDSWDEPTIIAWFEANTGPGAIGISESQMWNPTPNGLTITQSWLESNEGNGHVFQEDGRWIVEAVQTGWFVVDANDVTLRGCLALVPDDTPVAGIRRPGSVSEPGPTIIVEYCRVRAADGVTPSSRGVEGSNFIVRHTRVGPGLHDGTGLRMWNDNLIEYNWVHDLTGHFSGIGIRGSDSVIRRNYTETGSSASMFIYAHDSGAPSTGLTNLLLEENYLNSPSAWYAMNPGGNDNDQALSSTNIQVINNRWGAQCFWPGDESEKGGSHHYWLGRAEPGECEDDQGNIWTGNHWIETGNYIAPQIGQFAFDHPDDVYDDPCVEDPGDPGEPDGYSDTVLADNPIAYWRFEETSGTTASDSAGAHAATLVDDPQLDVAGRLGSGIRFIEANGSFAEAPDDVDLDLTGSLSIAFWVNILDGWTGTAWEALIGKGDDTYQVRRSGSGGNLRFDLRGGSGGNVSLDSGFTMPTNEWVHVVAVYDADAGEMRFYFNGEQDPNTASRSGTVATNSHGLQIGSNFSGTEYRRFFDGKLDEVAVFDYALSGEQVAAHYDAAFAPDTEPPTAPGNLSATAISENAIDLEWDASTDNVGVAGYDIYRDGAFLNTTTTTFYPDSGLEPETTYTYVVYAFDAADNVSEPSNEAQATTFEPDTEPPTAPGNLTATAVSSSRIDLEWDASTDNVGVEGYDIYRDGAYLNTTAETSYPDTGLTPNTTYSYVVYAFDAANNVSPPSNEAQATTLEQTDVDASWEQVVAVSTDIDEIRGWYQANTGLETYFCPDLGRTITEDDLDTISGYDIWEDGTVLEKKRITGRIRIFADDVVIRGCKFEMSGYTNAIHIVNSPGAGPGGDTAYAGSNWTVEHVTIVGNPDNFSNRAIIASTPGEARFVKVPDGFSSGLRSEGSTDQVWEYCYVDRIVTSPGSHNTAFTLRSNDGGSATKRITVRRSLFMDGTSAALSNYTRSDQLHEDLLFEENIFDIFYPDERSVNYCTNRGDGSASYVNVRWIGNIFGQSQTTICGTSGPYAGGMASEWTDNRYVDGGPL